MKKLLVLPFLLALAAGAASANEEMMEKKGFLTTETCIKQGYFKDCPLASAEYSPLVLYVHDDLKYYFIDASAIPKHEVDEGVNRNGVTIVGTYSEAFNTIKASEYKAPPPPTKSFFKGCL